MHGKTREGHEAHQSRSKILHRAGEGRPRGRDKGPLSRLRFAVHPLSKRLRTK